MRGLENIGGPTEYREQTPRGLTIGGTRRSSLKVANYLAGKLAKILDWQVDPAAADL